MKQPDVEMSPPVNDSVTYRYKGTLSTDVYSTVNGSPNKGIFYYLEVKNKKCTFQPKSTKGDKNYCLVNFDQVRDRRMDGQMQIHAYEPIMPIKQAYPLSPKVFCI